MIAPPFAIGLIGLLIVILIIFLILGIFARGYW